MIKPAPTGSSPNTPRAADGTKNVTLNWRAVLEQRADRVRLCGIHRWLGGVQLAGTGRVWRWDGERQRLQQM